MCNRKRTVALTNVPPPPKRRLPFAVSGGSCVCGRVKGLAFWISLLCRNNTGESFVGIQHVAQIESGPEDARAMRLQRNEAVHRKQMRELGDSDAKPSDQTLSEANPRTSKMDARLRAHPCTLRLSEKGRATSDGGLSAPIAAQYSDSECLRHDFVNILNSFGIPSRAAPTTPQFQRLVAYLRRGAAALLAPGQSQLEFGDPSGNFEIDICMRGFQIHLLCVRVQSSLRDRTQAINPDAEDTIGVSPQTDSTSSVFDEWVKVGKKSIHCVYNARTL
jgi:hypothetical protein